MANSSTKNRELTTEISITWNASDIRKLAEERGYQIPTDEECSEILEELLDKHDAEIGINWDIIEEYLAV